MDVCFSKLLKHVAVSRLGPGETANSAQLLQFINKQQLREQAKKKNEQMSQIFKCDYYGSNVKSKG